MSKEVQIVAYCDGEHEHRTEGPYEHTVTLDGAQPVLLDLCEEHVELIDAVSDLLKRGSPVKKGRGRPAAPPSPPPQPAAPTMHKHPWQPCPEPGCSGGGHGNVGLSQHLLRTHGKRAADYSQPA